MCHLSICSACCGVCRSTPVYSGGCPVAHRFASLCCAGTEGFGAAGLGGPGCQGTEGAPRKSLTPPPPFAQAILVANHIAFSCTRTASRDATPILRSVCSEGLLTSDLPSSKHCGKGVFHQRVRLLLSSAGGTVEALEALACEHVPCSAGPRIGDCEPPYFEPQQMKTPLCWRLPDCSPTVYQPLWVAYNFH